MRMDGGNRLTVHGLAWMPLNVRPRVYLVIVNEYTLLPDLPCPMRRYRVTVTLPRPDGDESLLPPGSQAVLELTAAATAAEGLLTAWTCTHSVVSMIVEQRSLIDALETGVAVARALQSGDGTASVTAEPVTTSLRLCVSAVPPGLAS
jgi:hypothetical protein